MSVSSVGFAPEKPGSSFTVHAPGAAVRQARVPDAVRHGCFSTKPSSTLATSFMPPPEEPPVEAPPVLVLPAEPPLPPLFGSLFFAPSSRPHAPHRAALSTKTTSL